MKKTKEEVPHPTEEMYNYHQISNHFALNERDRRVLYKKYGDQDITLTQWEILFKTERKTHPSFLRGWDVSDH